MLVPFVTQRLTAPHSGGALGNEVAEYSQQRRRGKPSGSSGPYITPEWDLLPLTEPGCATTGNTRQLQEPRIQQDCVLVLS